MLALCAVLAVAGCKADEEKQTEQEAPPATQEQLIANNLNITDDMISLVQWDEGTTATQKVTIATSLGDIVVNLYPEYAPKAVENFTALAKSGYYNGQKFYHLVNNYRAQAGDPTGTGTGGESSFKNEGGDTAPFPSEYSLNLWNFKGALGMTPSGDGTNDSKFYIVTNTKLEEETLADMQAANFPKSVQSKYEAHGGAPWLDAKCTVFGQVVEGFDIIDELSIAEVDANKTPVTDIVISKITVE